MNRYIKKGDIVYTPEWCAKDIIEFYKPYGSILDCASGKNKVFYNNYPKNCIKDYCELELGKDFFEYDKKVDWIITNPPYSKFRQFFRKAFELADNIVWLVPTWKVFSAYGLQKELIQWGGGINHIRWYGTGTVLGWSPLANGIGAIYFKKGHTNDTITQSFYNKPKLK